MFKRIFQRNPKDDEAGAGYAPGTSIAYDPDLIPRFAGHHQSLLKLFGKVHEAAEAKRFADVAKELGAFRRVLDQHLLEENLRLYVYLSKCLADDAENMSLVADMRHEMNRIGRGVREFIRQYADHEVDEDNVERFVSDLDRIGAQLTDRIEREEDSLYTLYMPPDDYALGV